MPIIGNLTCENNMTISVDCSRIPDKEHIIWTPICSRWVVDPVDAWTNKSAYNLLVNTSTHYGTLVK